MLKGNLAGLSPAGNKNRIDRSSCPGAVGSGILEALPPGPFASGTRELDAIVRLPFVTAPEAQADRMARS
jgi:hypothetical protein